LSTGEWIAIIATGLVIVAIIAHMIIGLNTKKKGWFESIAKQLNTPKGGVKKWESFLF